ncbi:MAG: DUF423 domain-containing protein [Planctomycetota bacterium]
MLRFWLFSGALLGGLSVAAGAFGAHGLKSVLEATGRTANWETAVHYSVYHALALLMIALVSALPEAALARGLLNSAGWCMLVGTLIFSGFLAALALSGLRILGAIVPIGGVLFLIGWALVAAAAWRIRA